MEFITYPLKLCRVVPNLHGILLYLYNLCLGLMPWISELPSGRILRTENAVEPNISLIHDHHNPLKLDNPVIDLTGHAMH
jgi:hypothetical protein